MNIGKVNTFDYQESKGIRMLSDILEHENLIKTYFKENDKTPNQDGHFLESNIKDKLPEKEFIVQIKSFTTVNKIKIENGIEYYLYRFDTKFFNYISKNVSENPAIVFIIDIINDIIYWKYIDNNFLNNLKLNQKTITLKFNNGNILKRETFYSEIKNIIYERRKERSKDNLKDPLKAFKFLNIYKDSTSAKEDIYKQIKTLYEVIKTYCKIKKININNLNVDISKLIDIVVNICRKEKYFKVFHDFSVINEIRTTSYWCYWFVKMKPFTFVGSLKRNNSLIHFNENFAIFFMLSIFSHKYKKNNFSSRYIKILEYHLIYHDISQESMFLLLSTIDDLLCNGGKS